MNILKNIPAACLAGIVLLSAGCSGGSSQGETIKLKVVVDRPNQGKLAVVVNRTEFYEMQLDSTHSASLEIKGYDCIYPDIIYNSPRGPVCKVFLKKGEDVTISLDAHRTAFSSGRREGFAVSTTSRNSKGADAAAGYLSNFPETAFPQKFELGLDDFVSLIHKTAAEACDVLLAEEIRAAYKDFVEAEKLRLEYAYAQNLLAYPLGHKMTDPDWVPGEDYYNAIEEWYVEHPELTGVTEYCDYMIFASKELAKRDSGEGVNPDVAAARYIGKHISDKRVKDVLEKMLVIDCLRFNAGKGCEELVRTAQALISDKKIIEAIEDEVKRQDPLYPGHVAPDFKAVDKDGNEYNLKSLRGKPVFIDVWATWCGPCRAEMPYLEEIAKKYPSSVQFVGISVDEDKTAWQQRVGRGDMTGLQLWAEDGDAFKQAYKISGIPRFILLDKWGRIIDAYAPRPSSGDMLTSKLDELK